MFRTGKAKYDCHSIVWLKANISSQPSHTFSPITTNFSNPVSQWSWGKDCDRSLKTHGSVGCCWTFFCTQRALSPPLSLHLRVISIISLKSLWLQPQWSVPADGGGQKNPTLWCVLIIMYHLSTEGLLISRRQVTVSYCSLGETSWMLAWVTIEIHCGFISIYIYIIHMEESVCGNLFLLETKINRWQLKDDSELF